MLQEKNRWAASCHQSFLWNPCTVARNIVLGTHRLHKNVSLYSSSYLRFSLMQKPIYESP